MNENDAFFGIVKRLIKGRNRGVPGRTKLIVPKDVFVSIGNNQPDRYLVVDDQEHVWHFEDVYQKSGQPLTTCLCKPLILHFNEDGEVAHAVHQEDEIEYIHR